MKTKLIITVFILISHLSLLTSQIPQGFNYQAIARGSDGKEIANTTLQVKLSVLSDTNGFYSDGKGTYIYEELQTVRTNNIGLFVLTFGSKDATWVQGKAGSFPSIDWTQQPLFIGTKINYSGWKNMGTSRLWTVPYAMVAGDLKNNSRVQVSGNASSTDSILFEVKNRTGQTVFAVYEEGVRIYVDDGTYKGRGKGGFAIGSFGAAKAPSQEYFRVTRDSTRIYTNPAAKGTKGGFAIGSFGKAKGLEDNYLNVTKENYFIGLGAGKSNTTGTFNSFLGYQTGFSNSDGSNNVFVGYQSGHKNTTGYKNTMIGYLAGYANTTGNSNTFIGDLAGNANTSGSINISIGPSAGLISNGDGNLFIGVSAGRSNTTGALNVFLGNGTGYTNTTSFFNTFLGTQAGYSNTEGSSNVYVGMNAGGRNVTGSGNVFIGSQAGYSETNVSNRLYIENSTNDKNSALIYGEFDTKLLTFNGNVGIGRTSPATRLDIAGGNWNVTGASEGDFRIGSATHRLKIGVATAGGGSGDVRMTAMGGTNRLILGGNGVDVLAVTNTNVYPWADNTIPLGLSTNRWSVVYSANGVVTTSDSRLKNNIEELGYGLESIMKLEPVSYTWKDGSDKNRKLGLLAQDVDKVISEVVDKGNDPAQTLGINYSELVPVLIKGMQEQQKQIDVLKAMINQLLEEKLK